MRTGSCRSTASPRSCTAGRPRSARSRRCTARSRSCGCSWSRGARPARPGRSSRRARPATGSAWHRTRSTSSSVERLADDAGSALASGDAEAAVARYREALAQWRGAPLADLAFEPFARPVIERLSDLRLTIAERCLGAELELGRGAELVAELEQLVLDNPLNERLRGQLMIALYRAGRQADALERFRTGRAALVEAFGLEPTPALKELERRVLQQDPSLDAPGRAPVAAPQDAVRTVLLAAWDDAALDRLVAVGTPTRRARPPRAAGHAARRARGAARRPPSRPRAPARDDLGRAGRDGPGRRLRLALRGRRHGASGADARGRRDGGRCRPGPRAGRPGTRRDRPPARALAVRRRAAHRDRRRRPSRAGSPCCSAGATTTGPQPSSGPGWPPGPGFRCGWSARGARGATVPATPAGSSRRRPSPSSGSSAWRRIPSSRTRGPAAWWRPQGTSGAVVRRALAPMATGGARGDAASAHRDRHADADRAPGRAPRRPRAPRPADQVHVEPGRRPGDRQPRQRAPRSTDLERALGDPAPDALREELRLHAGRVDRDGCGVAHEGRLEPGGRRAPSRGREGPGRSPCAVAGRRSASSRSPCTCRRAGARRTGPGRDWGRSATRAACPPRRRAGARGRSGTRATGRSARRSRSGRGSRGRSWRCGRRWGRRIRRGAPYACRAPASRRAVVRSGSFG